MSTKQKHIEKYDFDAFEKEQKPFTMIRTEVIQRIPVKHAQEFLLWVYLESLPETWKPNKTHLTHHFNISDRTYERYMSWLNSVGLIEYRQTRSAGGTFGKGRLIVLNGSKFNPSAASIGTVNVDGSVVDKRKKEKLSTEKTLSDPTNLSVPKKTPTTPKNTSLSGSSPSRQKTALRCDGAHIKTINRNRKAKRKTNNETSVSVFSDKQVIKDHIYRTISNRGVFVEDDIVNQIVFYIGACLVYDEVIKKINIALKKIRQGKWNIPSGYKGITSKSIRDKDEINESNKRAQYEEEAKSFRNITNAVASQKPYVSLVERLAAYRDGIDANGGSM